jgi:hypothetical protein
MYRGKSNSNVLTGLPGYVAPLIGSNDPVKTSGRVQPISQTLQTKLLGISEATRGVTSAKSVQPAKALPLADRGLLGLPGNTTWGTVIAIALFFALAVIVSHEI